MQWPEGDASVLIVAGSSETVASTRGAVVSLGARARLRLVPGTRSVITSLLKRLGSSTSPTAACPCLARPNRCLYPEGFPVVVPNLPTAQRMMVRETEFLIRPAGRHLIDPTEAAEAWSPTVRPPASSRSQAWRSERAASGARRVNASVRYGATSSDRGGHLMRPAVGRLAINVPSLRCQQQPALLRRDPRVSGGARADGRDAPTPVSVREHNRRTPWDSGRGQRASPLVALQSFGQRLAQDEISDPQPPQL